MCLLALFQWYVSLRHLPVRRTSTDNSVDVHCCPLRRYLLHSVLRQPTSIPHLHRRRCHTPHRRHCRCGHSWQTNLLPQLPSSCSRHSGRIFCCLHGFCRRQHGQCRLSRLGWCQFDYLLSNEGDLGFEHRSVHPLHVLGDRQCLPVEARQSWTKEGNCVNGERNVVGT